MSNDSKEKIYNCPLCSYFHENLLSLSIHYRNQHKKSSKELYITLYCDGVEPKCACGCGEEVKFHTLFVGFSRFRKGHQSRVNNNWGHNKTSLKKSQETRRLMHKNKEITVWNKGKTKEDDERIAKYGKKCKETILENPENILLRSERMRENRLNGTIPTLYGTDHPHWKGGTSALQTIVRSHLFNVWSFPKLQEAKFCCSQCCSTSYDGVSLNVHHNDEKFADILHKAILAIKTSNIEYKSEFEYKIVICDWVCKYHIDNNVSGVVLCENCHKKLHSK